MVDQMTALEGGNYQVPNAPAQTPTGFGGGWGGIIASGLAVAGGIAADNEYLVAGGTGAAGSFVSSYDMLNKSITEEQRTQRLNDAQMARNMQMKQYERDLTAPDRALAQENVEFSQGIATQEMALKNTEAARLGKMTDSNILLNQQKMEESKANQARLNMSPAQKAAEAVEVATLMDQYQIKKDDAAKAKLVEKIQSSELAPSVKRMLVFQTETGLDLSKLKKTSKPREVTTAMIEMAGEEFERLKTDPDIANALSKAEGPQKEQLLAKLRLTAANTVKGTVDYISGGVHGGNASVTTLFPEKETGKESTGQSALTGSAPDNSAGFPEMTNIGEAEAGAGIAASPKAVDNLVKTLEGVKGDKLKQIQLLDAARKRGPSAVAAYEQALAIVEGRAKTDYSALEMM